MSAMIPIHITRFLRRLAALRGNKGGILALDADGLPAIFPLGTDTYAVVADSSKELGLDYQAGGGGGVSSVNGKNGVVTLAAADVGAYALSTVTTKGDLTVATGAGAITRLAAGADGTIIVADSTAGGGWKTSTLAAAGAALAATKINATAPVTIDGGASATLAADRTIAIATATTTTQGTIELAEDGEATSSVVPTGADFRLKHSLWGALNSTVNVTFTNAPAAATEVFNSSGAYRAHCNLQGYKYVRFYVRISTTAPASGSRCALQYSIDGGTNWRNMDVGSGSSASPDTGAVVTAAPWSTVMTYNSGKVAIDAAAQADDVWLRCLTDGGDGVIDWIGQKIEAVFTEA